MSQLALIDVPRVDPDDLPNDRYTLRSTLDWCQRTAGVDGWDLDVAACEEAHVAPRWYGIEQDGLAQRWNAPRVWCNPPYSDIDPWVARAWRALDHRECEVLAMLLPATRTEQPWWQQRVEPFRDGRDPRLTVHFVPGRQVFGIPGNPLGVGIGSPPFGVVLLVWRRR